MLIFNDVNVLQNRLTKLIRESKCVYCLSGSDIDHGIVDFLVQLCVNISKLSSTYILCISLKFKKLAKMSKYLIYTA